MTASDLDSVLMNTSLANSDNEFYHSAVQGHARIQERDVGLYNLNTDGLVRFTLSLAYGEM